MQLNTKLLTLSITCLIIQLLSTITAIAQCPMCKAAAESNINEGGTHGLGLNAGIIYLFLSPYIIVATIGIIWWWSNKKAKLKEKEAEYDMAHQLNPTR